MAVRVAACIYKAKARVQTNGGRQPATLAERDCRGLRGHVDNGPARGESCGSGREWQHGRMRDARVDAWDGMRMSGCAGLSSICGDCASRA